MCHKELQYIFQNEGWIEGRLEFFRKFNRFGVATLPLAEDMDIEQAYPLEKTTSS